MCQNANSLQAVFHLQTMFQAAQKLVCVGEFGQFGVGQKFAVGEPITTENYGRVADALRRDLRVAQVVCTRV